MVEGLLKSFAMDVSLVLDTLNESQREAVAAPAGNIMVLAGAGSGKTRVLVHPGTPYRLVYTNQPIQSIWYPGSNLYQQGRGRDAFTH